MIMAILYNNTNSTTHSLASCTEIFFWKHYSTRYLLYDSETGSATIPRSHTK